MNDEMGWTLAFFRAEAKKWSNRRQDMGIAEAGEAGMETMETEQRGHLCYTFKQEDMWLSFAALAEDQFSKVQGSQPI